MRKDCPSSQAQELPLVSPRSERVHLEPLDESKQLTPFVPSARFSYTFELTQVFLLDVKITL